MKTLVARLARTITWIEALGYANVALFVVFLIVLGTKRIPESVALIARSVVATPDAWTLLVEVDAPAAAILERGQGHTVSFTVGAEAAAALTGHLTRVEHVAAGRDGVYRLSVRLEEGTGRARIPALPASMRARVLSSTFLQIFMRRSG